MIILIIPSAVHHGTNVQNAWIAHCEHYECYVHCCDVAAFFVLLWNHLEIVPTLIDGGTIEGDAVVA